MIKIKNLKIKTIIGAFEWERDKKQEVIFNITIHCDLSKAALSDHLADTLDYGVLTQQIIEKVENSKFYLIEALGNAVLDLILEHESVSGATIEVDKPGAIPSADAVSIVLSSP